MDDEVSQDSCLMLYFKNPKELITNMRTSHCQVTYPQAIH